MYFLTKILYLDYCSRDTGKIFPSQIRGRIVQLPFLRTLSAHNWNLYFG